MFSLKVYQNPENFEKPLVVMGVTFCRFVAGSYGLSTLVDPRRERFSLEYIKKVLVTMYSLHSENTTINIKQMNMMEFNQGRVEATVNAQNRWGRYR